MVAENLIPWDRLIKARRLVRFLIVDSIGSEMGARTRNNELAVDNVDIPPCFVVQSGISDVAQTDAEIKRFPFVEDVYRLDGGIKNLSCIWYDRRIYRSDHRI